MAEIQTVGVIGSGTMGSGIAIVAARAGFRAILHDNEAAALARARRQTEGFLQQSVERKRLSEAERERILGDIVGTGRLDDLAPADIVIEAVFENLAVKHEVLAKAHRVCGPEAIFASNTSTLSITEIAAGSGRAERFIGMHFCLPAPLMKLVEMSPGLRTDEAVFATAWAFCEAMGQRPVKTKDEPGFILNAFLVPYNNDAIRLVEAGVAEPAEIDRAMKRGMGYPMGPLELIDLIGLDTQLLLCEALYGRTRDPRAACPPLVRRMIAAGFLGRKAGQGFYRYERDAMFGG